MKSNCNYIFEKILLLPNFMQKKIIYYNIWNYLQINDKKTSAQALSKIPPFKDFNFTEASTIMPKLAPSLKSAQTINTITSVTS